MRHETLYSIYYSVKWIQVCWCWWINFQSHIWLKVTLSPFWDLNHNPSQEELWHLSCIMYPPSTLINVRKYHVFLQRKRKIIWFLHWKWWEGRTCFMPNSFVWEYRCGLSLSHDDFSSKSTLACKGHQCLSVLFSKNFKICIFPSLPLIFVYPFKYICFRKLKIFSVHLNFVFRKLKVIIFSENPFFSRKPKSQPKCQPNPSFKFLPNLSYFFILNARL